MVLERAGGAVSMLIPLLNQDQAQARSTRTTTTTARTVSTRRFLRRPSKLTTVLTHLAGSGLAWAQLALVLAALTKGDAGNA